MFPFFVVAWFKVALPLFDVAVDIAQVGMASHEETPPLSLHNAFRCVPEDAVTVENVLISTAGEVGHENIVSV